jgi:hypothetical protein
MTRQFTMQRGTTRVVFGSGASQHVREEIERLGVQRVVVVSTARRTDEAAAMLDRLGARGAAVMPLAREHVPQETVNQARREVERLAADAVLALGGGSAIGLAKALALTTPVRVVCVPTTYSGSEMTPVYGITDGGEKKTGRDERVRPALVIYDPRLTFALPRAATLPSVWNAMAHAVEGLWARSPDRATALIAEAALRLLVGALPRRQNAPRRTRSSSTGRRSPCAAPRTRGCGCIASVRRSPRRRIFRSPRPFSRPRWARSTPTARAGAPSPSPRQPPPWTSSTAWSRSAAPAIPRPAPATRCTSTRPTPA